MSTWDRVVMIPACKEFDYLPTCLDSLSKVPVNTLAVVVVNHRQNADGFTRNNNQQTLEWLLSHTHKQHVYGEYWVELPALTVLVLDYVSTPLAAHQGVGKARDIGMRRCCELIVEGKISQPWIWSTDADARFEEDYLDLPPSKVGVGILPYLHHPAPPSLEIYDIGLRYYAQGLYWAASPYAFPTLGSVICIHHALYTGVNGFPDRQAGEDFYLLNKACKMGVLKYLNRQPVRLEGRYSDRVPFGTGRKTIEIHENELQHQFYHPNCFAVVRAWIKVLNTVSDDQLIPALMNLVPHFPGLRKLAKITKQKVSRAQQIKRRHEWFDAFWTMKLIHHVRDTQSPSIDWEQALDEAEFIDFQSSLPLSRSAKKKVLEAQELQLLVGKEFGMSVIKKTR